MHVLYELVICRSGFITRYPSSINEFNLCIFDEILPFVLCMLALVRIPLLEKHHICNGELSVFIIFQGGGHSIKDLLNQFSVVAVNGVQPTSILVRMRDQMHIVQVLVYGLWDIRNCIRIICRIDSFPIILSYSFWFL